MLKQGTWLVALTASTQRLRTMGMCFTSHGSIAELSDVVNRTEGAEKLVAPAIRKHLEGDSIYAQKRVLTVLEGLVEMGSPKFQSASSLLTVRAVRDY